MRRLILAVLAAMVVLAGCGSSHTGAPADPLASALSYFPAQTPFVATIATSSGTHASAQTQALEQRLPLAAAGEAALTGQLEKLGINYQRDIRPLLGNPVAFGDASPSLTAFQSDFLVAWVTKDASKLDALVAKLHAHGAGTHNGAKFYTSSGAALAIDGPTILLAKTESDVIAALDRHAHGGGVSSAQYAAGVAGLPAAATVHMYGNLTGVLSTAQAAKARRVAWVAALRSYGATFGSTAQGVTIQFRLNTDGSSLSSAQLPIASGSGSPALVAGLPIQVGIRDPAQIVQFAEAAEQTTSPQGYAKFLRDQAKVRRKTGVDLNNLLSQLNGDLIVDTDTHTILVRAGVSNPGAVVAVLSKLASTPNGLGSSTSIKPTGGGLYSFSQGGRSGELGVVGSQLVLAVAPVGGHSSPAALRSFAAAPSAPAPGTSGAVAFRISVSDLLALSKQQTASPIASELLGLLGDFTGSMAATPAALTGSATLALK